MPFIEGIKAFDIGGNLISRAFIDELKEMDVWKKAANFQNEVLLIHGTKDEAAPYNVFFMLMEKCYQKATLHTIEGADHTYNSFGWEQEGITSICDFVTA